MGSHGVDWSRYNQKISHFAQHPINEGVIDETTAKGDGGELFVSKHAESEEKVTWYWVIEPQSKTIIRVRFTSEGNPVAKAVYDMAAMLLRTKALASLPQQLNYNVLERFLRDHPAQEALPESDRHLITFAVTSIKEAAQRYLGTATTPTIVCKCAHVSLETIQEAIKLHDLKSVEEITDYTKAGAYCKSCLCAGCGGEEREIYLDELLAQTRREIEEENARNFDDTPFEKMDTPQKIAFVNKIIDEKIRQFLIMDGGDMEILDIKDNGEHTDIYIRYLGACSGCASASTGTLFAIENALKEALGPNTRVLPL